MQQYQHVSVLHLSMVVSLAILLRCDIAIFDHLVKIEYSRTRV